MNLKMLLFYLKVESDEKNPVKTIYSSDFEIYKAKEDIELEKLNDNEINIENYDLTKPLNAERKKYLDLLNLEAMMNIVL